MTVQSKTRVGFIGLGSQGAPMAQRILDAGFPLTVWARRREPTESFAAGGCAVAADPAALGAASDVVGICVVADADVEDVVLRADGVLFGMAAGAVIAIHSTVHPDTCRRVAEAAARRGVFVIDAPVSGGAPAASTGSLLVMAGGDAAHLARCRPVFESYADPIVHLGPLGSGQLAKLLNNTVFTAQLTLALETFAFVDELGMDRAEMARVLAHGSGGSRVTAILAASGFNSAGIRGAAGLLRKDLGITRAVARSRGAREPEHLIELAEHTLRGFSREGG